MLLPLLRSLTMKILTAMLLACLSGTGAACSQTTAQPSDSSPDTRTAQAPAEIQPTESQPPVTGTLNLNIGGRPTQPDSPLLGAGGLSPDTGRPASGLIGAGVFGGGDFLEAPDISIGDATGGPAAETEPSGAAGQDGEALIRLPE